MADTDEEMNYSVNIPSLHAHFPSGFPVPQLLLDFATWLKDKPMGSLGYFRLESSRFDDYWIENGADLYPHFAFFMRDPTGGQIGYWLFDGPATVAPPIVLIGSEGETQIISETLEEFLKRLAEGNTEVSDLDDREQDDNIVEELTDWLESRDANALLQNHQTPPDITKWMKQWGQQQHDWINKDTLHVQIADKLRKYVKPDAKSWETTAFDVVLVGTQFKMWHRSFGAKLLPQDETTALEPLFRAVREQRAQKMPERGLWFYSSVKVGSQGGAVLCCNFMEKPTVADKPIAIQKSDYEQDLQAFPRSKHWTPDWLNSL